MTDRNSAFVSALVEGLARSGVRHACVSPGSRNTPLSIAFAAHPGIEDWSHHDERSGSFFALGLAATTGTPVVVVTTSGTAAAELHPAVVEASSSRVPLILITADRPTELFDVGAPQTIDQRHLFGTSVRWDHDLDVPDPTDAGPAVTAALAARLVLEATTTPAGPVHVNVRFREPLVAAPDFHDIRVPAVEPSIRQPSDNALDEMAHATAGRPGIIVAGPSHDREAPHAAARLASIMGWPILSDPVSGLRAGVHDTDHVVGSDLLAAGGALDRLSPASIIRIGAPPTSKALRRWLATSGVPQVVIAPGGWPDPDASSTLVVRADVTATLLAFGGWAEAADAGWMSRWSSAQEAATAAASAVIDAAPSPSEPAIARSLLGAVPDQGVVWTASSMPVRDLDSFAPVTARPIRIHGNRGANGIDGLASTALGAAAGGLPTVAHLGDLSMLHDVGVLATAARLGLPITFLVVNNDGGGIFHFLPQAGHEHFERHFGTPHGLSFRDIAEGFGLEAMVAESIEDVITAVAETGEGGPRLVEVRTDRHANVALHREIATAVSAAVAGA